MITSVARFSRKTNRFNTIITGVQRLLVRLFPGIFLFLVSMVILAWGTLPPENLTKSVSVPPSAIFLPKLGEAGNGSTALPVLSEERRLALHWPPVLRPGDAGMVILSVEPYESSGLNSGPADPAQDSENLAGTHNILAEARLELPGLQVSPTSAISQPMLAGRTVTFRWEVQAVRVGEYSGTVWLSLRFLSLEGNVAADRPVSAQVIDLRSEGLLGLSGSAGRYLGSAGLLTGVFLCLNAYWPEMGKRLKAGKNHKH